MVLCQDTRYVLLDEPLNNLDMKHAVAMMGTLRRAADELGKTVVLVLHDINFASCYADRIVALKQGRVACQGAPAELVRAGAERTVRAADRGARDRRAAHLRLLPLKAAGSQGMGAGGSDRGGGCPPSVRAYCVRSIL